jgi:hypothetical protein
MELNLIYHMHCIPGVIINFDLLLNWVGIFLYLVIANKILTNLIGLVTANKILVSPLVSLTLYMSSQIGEFMHIIPHNLLSDECM